MLLSNDCNSLESCEIFDFDTEGAVTTHPTSKKDISKNLKQYLYIAMRKI